MPSRIAGPCPSPGCPNKAGQCAKHRRQREQARGTRQARGYDAQYDALRRADVRRMADGEVFNCWRCGHAIARRDYSLGHCDDDRSIIHGPEHLTRCNLANTRGGCPHISHT